MPPRPMTATRRALWLGLPLVAYALVAWRFDFLCDDAFISFRYSKHLAEGHGLRYNLGADPPVEGYSNFLWVVWLGALRGIGLEITTWARLSSFLCGGLLLCWVTSFAARRFELDDLGALALGLFTATLPPIALWATGGLATMPMTLLLFGCFAFLLGDPDRPRTAPAALFAALAALLRADGAAFVGLLLLAAGILWLVERRPRALLRAALVTGLVLGIVVAAQVAWRLSYYGEPLPNTARVKAGFSPGRLARGADYLAAYFLTLPSVGIAIAAGLRRWRPGLRSVWIPTAVVITGTSSYALYVGGDFMPMGRFLMPMMPFAVLMLGSVGAAAPRLGLSIAGVALSIAATFDHNPVPHSVRTHFQFRADRPWETEVEMWAGMKLRAEQWSIQGRALGHCTRAGESIILGAIGALGFYCELEVHDTYGLVSPSVAAGGNRVEGATPGHDVRVLPDFFFDQHPDYLGSVLTRIDAPELEGLPANWPTSHWRELVTIEHCPLPEGEGFPPGVELRLLRFREWE